jgi:hypothetical protein
MGRPSIKFFAKMRVDCGYNILWGVYIGGAKTLWRVEAALEGGRRPLFVLSRRW